jgi:hypothetical protein
MQSFGSIVPMEEMLIGIAVIGAIATLATDLWQRLLQAGAGLLPAKFGTPSLMPERLLVEMVVTGDARQRDRITRFGSWSARFRTDLSIYC